MDGAFRLAGETDKSAACLLSRNRGTAAGIETRPALEDTFRANQLAERRGGRQHGRTTAPICERHTEQKGERAGVSGPARWTLGSYRGFPDGGPDQDA